MKRSIEVLTILLPTLCVLTFADAVLARSDAKSVAASCPDSSPVIDGVLDEACWAVAQIATDFTDSRTERPAVEQTRVRVLYDDTYVYFGFECLEPDVGKIVAFSRKYDQNLQGEDRVEVRLDTFHDQRSAYVFAVNTLGTRYDARSGVFGYDDSWGCDWTAAATVAEDRWFAEIAIPIARLLFDKKDGVEWGCNFSRAEHGLQERSYWCYRNSQANFPRQFGLLTGLDLANVKVSHRPAFETYASSTYDVNRGDAEFSTGLDASLRLSSELTSAFALNPDYGQVEADPDTIELRDTERFLDEKRPFFREGSELFSTPVSIYYSRRLQEIDAGAKLTGQGRRWAAGLIDVEGQIRRDDRMESGNYHVGRYIHNVGELSHVGGIWTGSFREDGSNAVGGLDSRVFLDSTTSLTTQVLGLSDSEGIATDEQIDDSGYAAHMGLNGGTQPLWWGINFRDISRGFRPDLGYVPRRDIRGPSTFLDYRQNLQSGSFKWIGGGTEVRLYENNDHDTTLRDFDERVGLCLRNEIELWYLRADRYHAPYQNWSDGIRIEYNEEVDVWNSVSFGVQRGEYETEPYVEYSLEKPQRITDRLVTTLGGDYRQWTDREDDETMWLWRSVTQYNFTWNARLKFTAEQTSEGRHNLTALYSWPVKKQIDVYLLWNDYATGEEDVNSVFLKFVYRF